MLVGAISSDFFINIYLIVDFIIKNLNNSVNPLNRVERIKQVFMIKFNTIYNIQVSPEPVRNMIYSIILIQKTEKLSGMNHWPIDIANKLTDSEKRIHRLVTEAFPIMPVKSWNSFPSYLDYLGKSDPIEFRKKYFNEYVSYCSSDFLDPHEVNIEKVVQSEENYLAFVKELCGSKNSTCYVDIEFEKNVYQYLVKPERMLKETVSHLRMIWDRFLAEEWVKVEKIVLDSVNAVNQLNLMGLEIFDAIKKVTEKDAKLLFKQHTLDRMQSVKRYVFIPSPHVGPYMNKLIQDDTMWIFFGARLPKGVCFSAPDLDHQEIVTKLGAIADNTRLKILKHISTVGERSSAQIICDLNLSQSAASRHLKQLSATGLLLERRVQNSKCYSINEIKIKSIFKSVTKYLIVDS